MSATEVPRLARRIAYVDGLRAIAVLLVVVHHAAKWDGDLGQGLLQQVWAEGAHGVDLFFVLSGFCLSYPLLRELHAKGWSSFDIAGYMARRIVRIVPPFWIAITVLCLVLAFAGRIGWHVEDAFSLARLNWYEIGKQALFIDREPVFVNPSFWTLPIEWRWYFLMPLFLLLWTRSPRAFATAGIALACGAALSRVGRFDLSLLPGFLLGIVAADVELRQITSGRRMLLFSVLACVVAFAADWFYRYDLVAGWQLAAFFFVLAVGSIPTLRRMVACAPLAWLGLASYSIYLVHEPLIATVEHNTTVGPFVAGAAAVAAGCLFWAAFERPFLSPALRRPLVRWIRPRLAGLCALAGVADTIGLRVVSATSLAPAGVDSAASSTQPGPVLADLSA